MYANVLNHSTPVQRPLFDPGPAGELRRHVTCPGTGQVDHDEKACWACTGDAHRPNDDRLRRVGLAIARRLNILRPDAALAFFYPGEAGSETAVLVTQGSAVVPGSAAVLGRCDQEEREVVNALVEQYRGVWLDVENGRWRDIEGREIR